MIRKLNGQIYGPFETDTIKAWIEASKMEARDEVAKVGGQWRTLDSHPTFAKVFPSSPVHQASLQPATTGIVQTVSTTLKIQPRQTLLQWLKKRKPTAYQLRDLGENVVGLFGTGAALAVSWYLIQAQWLLIPESWLTSAHSLWEEQVYARLNRAERASIAWEEYTRVLTRLQSSYSPPYRPSSLLTLKARQILLEDTTKIQSIVRPLLEEAVASDPQNDLAIVALAEVYAADNDVARQKDASRLIDVAEELNPGSAEVHRARAALFVATRNSEKAREEGRSALARHPEDAEALLVIGSSYLHEATPNWQESLSHLKKAVDADPRLHRAWHELGQVYLAQREYRLALEAFQKKLDLAPNSVSTLLEMAKLLEQVGEFPRALELNERAHRLSQGQEPRATLTLAIQLYQRRGDLRRARELLLTLMPKESAPVLSLPDQKLASVHLATCLRLEGAYEQALTVLAQVLKDDSGFGPALFQKGLILLATNRLDSAGQALRAAGAAENDPEVGADIKFYIGQVLSRQDKIKDSLQEYEDAIEDFKYHIPSFLGMIQLQLGLAQHEEAQSRAHELARLDPLYLDARSAAPEYFHRPPPLAGTAAAFQKVAQEKFYISDSFTGLAALQLRSGQRGQAMQSFSKALDVKENDSTALFNLGIMALENGNSALASRNFLTLLEQDSQFGLAWVYLVRASTELGRLDQASTALENALRYERTNPVLAVHQSLLALKKGDPTGARKALLKAIELDSRYLTARRELFKLQRSQS